MRHLAALPVWYVCSFFDRFVPRWDTIDHRWYRCGGWGCYPLRISGLALWIEGDR